MSAAPPFAREKNQAKEKHPPSLNFDSREIKTRSLLSPLMRVCLLMLLRVSSAVSLLPVARRAGVKSLPAIASKVTTCVGRLSTDATLLTAPRAPASVLFPRLARRSMTVRACTAAELSPEEVVAAVDAQGKEVKRLKGEEGLGNKDPQVSAAVAELLRLKALLPQE